jgi:hypothetical protein
VLVTAAGVRARGHRGRPRPDVFTFDLDVVGTPFCVDESAQFEFTGQLRQTFATTTDATGASHSTITQRWIDATAVDLATGDTYRFIEVDHRSSAVDVDGGMRVVYTANGLLVGQGNLRNVNVHIETVTVFGSDDGVTSLVDEIHISCGG